MKIKLLAFGLILAASSGTGFAQSAGTFGFGIELDGTGATATNSGVTTLYALDNGGTDRLLPIEPANTGSPSTATLSTAWSGASTAAAPTFSLGTFTEGVGTLTLEGGAMLTFKNGGENVNGASLNYEILPVQSSFTSVNLPFNQDSVNGNTGDQRWATESLSTNLLAGLTPGTYTLDVFGEATTDIGGSPQPSLFDSNGGANFGATFTVAAAAVPEPGTWAMMLGGLAMLVCFQRLRRKSVV